METKPSIFAKSSSIVLSILISSIIIYVLVKLRDISCNCIVDWRNSFGITASSFSIFTSLLLTILLLSNVKSPVILGFSAGLLQLNFLFNAINVFSLYSYTKDLSNSDCNCLSSNEPYYSIVYYAVRISLILFIIFFTIIILFPFLLFFFMGRRK